MNPNEVSLKNIAKYAAHLITEFYKGNLEPYFEALDDNVVWCGALDKQFIHGKDNVLKAFDENPQDIKYSVGPVYTETIPHGQKQCDTLSFFERYAYYPDGSVILWHTCFHLSWVKKDVWKMSVITLSPKAERYERDRIYQSHPLSQLTLNIAAAEQYERIIFKERYTGNLLYLSPISIEYIEGDGHHSTIHYGNSSCVVTESLKSIIKKTGNVLLQCHSGYIVNPYNVQELGRFFITLNCGIVIPIPEKKYTAVRQRLNTMLKRRN